MDNISLTHINKKRARNISLSKTSPKIDRDLHISLNYRCLFRGRAAIPVNKLLLLDGENSLVLYTVPSFVVNVLRPSNKS